jgi:8-oxo-dGTP pyrophosphatase MutT (NUDIX family)
MKKTENKSWSGGFFYDERSRKVLLHKRDGKTFINPNKWAFFGGTSKGMETPIQTFMREIKEELSVDLNDFEVVNLCSYFNIDHSTQRNVFFVKSKLKKTDMKLQEGADFDWIPLNQVFKFDLTPYTRKDLEFFIKNYETI